MSPIPGRTHDLIDRPPKGRRPMPAGRGLIVMLVTLLVWTLLYAPELKRSAQTHPEGTRRNVSLAVLTPLAWISDHVGLTAVTDAVARAVGRDPLGQVGGGTGGDDVEPLPTAPGPGGGRPKPPPVIDTPFREPTRDRPLRVVVVGDSLAVGIGYFAERVFKPTFVDVRRQGRISTGLARPDYFDWPAQMQYIVDRYRPDLTIVLVGENDNQSLRATNGNLATTIGTVDWPPAYAVRVEQFARIATSRGGHVVWVGLPTVRDRSRWELIQRQNGIYAKAAAELPNVAFLDSWSMFQDPRSHGYTPYYRDGNRLRLVRENDGVHFNADGYTLLMRAVAHAAADAFGLDPKTFQ